MSTLPTREELNRRRLEYHYRYRRAFFDGKVCCECGTDEKLRLRYDGGDGLDLSNIWSTNRKRRAEILQQCRVMCRRCWDRSWSKPPGQAKVDALLHRVWIRNWRRYRWILRRQGIVVPVATPTEGYVKMVLETIATL